MSSGHPSKAEEEGDTPIRKRKHKSQLDQLKEDTKDYNKDGILGRSSRHHQREEEEEEEGRSPERPAKDGKAESPNQKKKRKGELDETPRARRKSESDKGEASTSKDKSGKKEARDASREETAPDTKPKQKSSRDLKAILHKDYVETPPTRRAPFSSRLDECDSRGESRVEEREESATAEPDAIPTPKQSRDLKSITSLQEEYPDGWRDLPPTRRSRAPVKEDSSARKSTSQPAKPRPRSTSSSLKSEGKTGRVTVDQPSSSSLKTTPKMSKSERACINHLKKEITNHNHSGKPDQERKSRLEATRDSLHSDSRPSSSSLSPFRTPKNATPRTKSVTIREEPVVFDDTVKDSPTDGTPIRHKKKRPTEMERLRDTEEFRQATCSSAPPPSGRSSRAARIHSPSPNTPLADQEKKRKASAERKKEKKPGEVCLRVPTTSDDWQSVPLSRFATVDFNDWQHIIVSQFGVQRLRDPSGLRLEKGREAMAPQPLDETLAPLDEPDQSMPPPTENPPGEIALAAALDHEYGVIMKPYHQLLDDSDPIIENPSITESTEEAKPLDPLDQTEPSSKPILSRPTSNLASSSVDHVESPSSQTTRVHPTASLVEKPPTPATPSNPKSVESKMTPLVVHSPIPPVPLAKQSTTSTTSRTVQSPLKASQAKPTTPLTKQSPTPSIPPAALKVTSPPNPTPAAPVSTKSPAKASPVKLKAPLVQHSPTPSTPIIAAGLTKSLSKSPLVRPGPRAQSPPPQVVRLKANPPPKPLVVQSKSPLVGRSPTVPAVPPTTTHHASSAKVAASPLTAQSPAKSALRSPAVSSPAAQKTLHKPAASSSVPSSAERLAEQTKRLEEAAPPAHSDIRPVPRAAPTDFDSLHLNDNDNDSAPDDHRWFDEIPHAALIPPINSFSAAADAPDDYDDVVVLDEPMEYQEAVAADDDGSSFYEQAATPPPSTSRAPAYQPIRILPRQKAPDNFPVLEETSSSSSGDDSDDEEYVPQAKSPGVKRSKTKSPHVQKTPGMGGAENQEPAPFVPVEEGVIDKVFIPQGEDEEKKNIAVFDSSMPSTPSSSTGRGRGRGRGRGSRGGRGRGGASSTQREQQLERAANMRQKKAEKAAALRAAATVTQPEQQEEFLTVDCSDLQTPVVPKFEMHRMAEEEKRRKHRDKLLMQFAEENESRAIRTAAGEEGLPDIFPPEEIMFEEGKLPFPADLTSTSPIFADFVDSLEDLNKKSTVAHFTMFYNRLRYALINVEDEWRDAHGLDTTKEEEEAHKNHLVSEMNRLAEVARVEYWNNGLKSQPEHIQQQMKLADKRLKIVNLPDGAIGYYNDIVAGEKMVIEALAKGEPVLDRSPVFQIIGPENSYFLGKSILRNIHPFVVTAVRARESLQVEKIYDDGMHAFVVYHHRLNYVENYYDFVYKFERFDKVMEEYYFLLRVVLAAEDAMEGNQSME